MVSINRLTSYSPEDAAGIGRLMPFLDEKFSGAPIDEQVLRVLIESNYHDQLVARDDTGRIVGAATLSLIMAAAAGPKAYLEDFVTDPETRGVGSALWEEMGRWCLERNVDLHFTSRPARVEAHQFYLKRGARMRETDVFVKDFRED